MNRKKTTIILFTISLIILVALQAYYIYNSYRLEEKELNRQARTIADKTLEAMEKYESDASEEKLVGDFDRLKKGITIQKEKITNPERLYTNEKMYSQKLEKILKDNIGDSGFEIAMKSEIFSIYDEVQKKELLPANRSLVLFQSVQQITNPQTINEGKWASRQTRENTDLKLDEKNYYLVKSKSTFQLLNIKSLVFRKVIPLVIISLLIIILIVYLFYNSIKNLNRQEKKISQLHTTIDSIAHELNTPITTLKFSVFQSEDSVTKELLQRQINRLESIVSSIHSFESEDVMITENEIENYFTNVKNNFRQINFQIKTDLRENKSLQQEDFRQMMNNLIDNSVKYGAKNLDITIINNSGFEILIKDDGIGIPKEDQKYIFDKYFRVDRKSNLNINGLGVGLFLVRSIVEKYKGKISVKSNSDKGVTFKIQIPNEN